MSDETPTPEAPDASDTTEAAATEAPATEVVPVPVAAAELTHATVAVERPTFRSKFLMPLIVPIAVAATIIFYVLNVSRIFLANDDTLAVVFASIITVVILGGGSALAASPKLRSSSLTLMTGGVLLVLLLGGMISIGAASPNVASGPAQCTAVTSKVTTTAGAGGALKFTPSQLTAKAGCVKVTVTFDGTHTFEFTQGAASTVFPTLNQSQNSWAANLPAGKYPFECTIPGHASAGMVGVLTVT
jgi:uncharacterized cupredoxin-like copper-binding protein